MQNITITTVCDREYYKYANVLINSTEKYNPKFNFFLRAVNYIDIGELRDNVRIIHDSVDLSKAPTGLKYGDISGLLNRTNISLWKGADSLTPAIRNMVYSDYQCYCSHVRFNNVNRLLQETEDDIIVVDADTIIRDDITGIQQLLDEYDICTRYIEEHGETRFLYEGFIAIKNNDINREYWKFVEVEINKNLSNWNHDSHVLKIAYAKFKNKVRLGNLPPKYKDEELSDKSCVWSGAFHIKNTEKFENEMRKYT